MGYATIVMIGTIVLIIGTILYANRKNL